MSRYTCTIDHSKKGNMLQRAFGKSFNIPITNHSLRYMAQAPFSTCLSGTTEDSIAARLVICAATGPPIGDINLRVFLFEEDNPTNLVCQCCPIQHCIVACMHVTVRLYTTPAYNSRLKVYTAEDLPAPRGTKTFQCRI
jgi:hypothetical protein